jgi:hypothetical protein
MSSNDFAGNNQPDSALGKGKPADPEALAGKVEPDLSSGKNKLARLHWGADLWGDKGVGIEAYDGKKFIHFSTVTEMAIAAAAAGIDDVRIERTDIPFGMERSAIQAEFVGRGVRLLQVTPKRTAYYRKGKVLGKSHKNDAFVIYHLKCDFSEPRKVSDEWKDFSARVNHQANIIRFTVGNTIVARILLKILGKGNVPKEVLTKGGTLSSGALAYGIATLNTKGRNQAERLSGAYGNGHSSYLRSNVFKHGFSTAKKHQGIPFTAYRRGLRQFGALVRSHRNEILEALPNLAV